MLNESPVVLGRLKLRSRPPGCDEAEEEAADDAGVGRPKSAGKPQPEGVAAWRF